MSATIIPTLRYEDAPAAIDFLVAAFGFTPQMVVAGDGGTIEHAQLVHGTGMIMLGSDRDNPYGELVESAGTSSVGLYVIVDDASAHAARAEAAGAEIVMRPEEQDYGGLLYTAKDPEGHVWSFGEYSPWADQTA